MKSEPEYPLRRHGMTEEEFYAYADEDCPWQFLGGELVREPVSEHHEDLFAFLVTLLRDYLGERGGGEVRGSRYAMRLDPKGSPEPDLLAVLSERHEDLFAKAAACPSPARGAGEEPGVSGGPWAASRAAARRPDREHARAGCPSGQGRRRGCRAARRGRPRGGRGRPRGRLP